MTEQRMSRTAIAFVVLSAPSLVASSAAPPSAYPIEPRPLRRLVAESQYVVTARVTSPDATAIRSGELATNVVLEIDEVLKGKLDTKRIPQSNEFGPICPTPARYEVGKRVLAFLDWKKEYGFTTHALSYGAKTLDDAAMKTYVARVKEELAIREMTDSAVRRKAQVEWLVKCAEDPATRWEGAYELAPAGDPMSAFDHEVRPGDDFARDLDDAQRKRLREAWYAAKDFGVGEMCLDELFLAERDPKALAWLVSRLRDHDGDEDVGDRVAWLIERIARRDERPAVAAVAKQFEETFSLSVQHDELRARHLRQIVRRMLALF